MTLTTTCIGLAEIERAQERIAGSIFLSPCPYSETLSRLTGQQIHLKLENLQMTGAFKERGALNKLLSLSKAEAERGVITASAGNHAQGVAYHASKLGIAAHIVMPLATPLVKMTATRNYGAEVILYGDNYDEAHAEAARRCGENGYTFVHPFDDPSVIAGQGTIGLELLRQVSSLEAVVVPIGGGGLIGGVACAIKETRPSVRVIGVQTARLPSMQAAVAHHKPVTVDAALTVADGIAVRRAGDLTLPLVEHYVDEIVTVEEEDIASAILVLLEREKTLAEGAGATALAALLQGKTRLRAERTAVLVGGGNIDVTLLARIIERGMVKDGRMVRLRIHLLDRPGALHELTRIIAEHRANIVELLFDRAYYGVNLSETVIDVTFETRDPGQVSELLAALTANGYKHEMV
ncbi:MAG: threonine ammonia-lyase, partial [Terriglobia bacterium]